MTTIFEQPQTCCVCGTQSSYPALSSTNHFGSPDLDLRPPPMARFTIEYWVQRCPSCGLCAGSVEEAPEIARQLLRSAGYLAQLDAPGYPALANQFLCNALILAASGNEAGAGHAALHAAWVCDDAGEGAQADACRLKAVTHFSRARQAGGWMPEDPGAACLLLADLHRRAGQREPAVALCTEGLGLQPEELVRSLLQVQRRLAEAGDRRCYTVDEAMQRFQAGESD